MGKKTQTKAGKASAPAKVPVKNSINLFIEEKHTGKNVAEIAIFAVFMVGVALFSKFCVQGKLDEMSRLESNYHQMEQQVAEAETSVENYEDLRVEYSHYGNGYLSADELAMQDRMAMLDLIEDELLKKGALLNFSLSENVATLTINSAKLASVSEVVRDLEASDIVTYAFVSTAATKDQNLNQNAESGKPEKVISTLTIYFKSPEGAEPSAETADENSVNPLTQAMENVAQGAASDLAQTNVEGNEE